MQTKDKFTNKMEFICSNIVKAIFSIIILGLLLLSVVGNATVDMKEHVTYMNDNIIINLLSIAIICGIAILLKRKNIKINKHFLYVSIAIWFGLCLYWIFLTKLQPRYDQKHIIDTAMNIWKKDFSFYRKRFLFGIISSSIWYYFVYLWFDMHFQ